MRSTLCALLAILSCGAYAQPQQRPTQPPPQQPLTRSSFTAKGLNHEDDLTDLFVGNFGGVSFNRGSKTFSVLFEAYLGMYSRHCSANLPTNKVEMTTVVCDDPPEPDPPFRLGEPVRPYVRPACRTWRTESLGWADPVLYAAKTQLDVEQATNQVKDQLRSVVDAFGSTKSIPRPIVDVVQLGVDMDALVRLNACGGAGLKRFQDNVVLFSKGKPPLLLPGAPAITSSAQPPGVLADSDFNRLVEDLVADQARTWPFYHYVPGSTSQVLVGHDPTGRPSQIRAKYLFTSVAKSGRTQGSLNVSFTDGMPKCIYFSDAPSQCQTPNRRIVANYASGGYVDPNALAAASSPAAAASVLPPPDRGASVQAKAQAEARVRGSVCVPDDLLAEWRNPPPGSKMDALQRQLKESLRERAKIPSYDQTKWMTVNSRIYSTWDPTGPFQAVVTATDGGSCAVGHREFLALTP